MYKLLPLFLLLIIPITAFADLQVSYIDLESRGDSTLLILPNNSTILIDGGLLGAYDILKETLQQNDITNIDLMIATHPDSDHISGLTKILEDDDFSVDTVFINHINSTTATFASFMEATQNANNVKIVYDGEQITLDDNVSINIISPPQSGIDEGANASESNSNSLITHVVYDDVAFLFTADATDTTEKYIIENHPFNINIMNAPHHGSKHASTTPFIETTDPELVIFSADFPNQYGHPTQETIDRYESYDENLDHYQTGLNGTIIIQTDGIGCNLTINDETTSCYDDVDMITEEEPVPVINEVEINPPGIDSASVSEWVELYNPTDSEIDLSGWEIASTTVLKKTLTLPDGTTIQPKEFMTFTYQTVWFTDVNESVELRDENGFIIDKTPLLSDLLNNFISWQRISDGYDTDSSSDWKFTTSTAGTPNGIPVEPEPTPVPEPPTIRYQFPDFCETKLSNSKITSADFICELDIYQLLDRIIALELLHSD